MSNKRIHVEYDENDIITMAVTLNEQTWRILTKITQKNWYFSDEQGLQNNFNRKYLCNSKMVVKFVTKFWKKREIKNFHNYWFLIWPSYFNLSEIIRKRTVFSANRFTEVRHRVHNYWIWKCINYEGNDSLLRHFDERQIDQLRDHRRSYCYMGLRPRWVGCHIERANLAYFDCRSAGEGYRSLHS
jgi:hypothetical protein